MTTLCCLNNFPVLYTKAENQLVLDAYMSVLIDQMPDHQDVSPHKHNYNTAFTIKSLS